MIGLLKSIVGRLVGAVIGAGAGVAAAKGLGEISPNSQAEVIAVIANAFMLIGYAIAHKLFDKK